MSRLSLPLCFDPASGSLARHRGDSAQTTHRASAVTDEADLDECYRLRYSYFVQARGWVPPDPERPGLECDAYDACCLHLAAVDEQGVAAYLRVLPFDALVGFMLDRELSCLLNEHERAALPRENAVELSRLVVRPGLARCRTDPHPVEVLLRLLYRESKARGFSRFYVVVEESWLKPFTRRLGLPFRPLGKPHLFPDGTKTMAAVATMDELEAGMRSHGAGKYAWYQEDERAE